MNNYDAYGNLLDADSQVWTGALPLTSYMYSGEAFDFGTGQQYLRARWYDPTNGRFNQLDPFAGNSSDPQSFHKYAYVHGDPVNGVDPSGMFLTSLAFANLAGLDYNLEVAMSGLIVAGILNTGGSGGLSLRDAGLALIAQGDLDAGWKMFNIGSAFAAKSFASTEQFVDAFQAPQLMGLVGVGVVKLLRSAPDAAQSLLNFSRSAFRKLADLPNLGRRAGGVQHFFNSTKWNVSMASQTQIGNLADAYNSILARIPAEKIDDAFADIVHYKDRDGFVHRAPLFGNLPGRQVYGSFEWRTNTVYLYKGYDMFTVIEELRHWEFHQEYVRNIGGHSNFARYMDADPSFGRAYNQIIERDIADWMARFGIRQVGS